MQYLLAALIASLLILGYLYKLEIAQHGATKEQLQIASDSAELVRLALVDNELKQAKLAAKNLAVTLDFNKVKRDLATMRARESAYIQKPELVSKLINKDFLKDERELSCLTGDVSLCL